MAEPMNTCQGWIAGPEDTIDRMIARGYDAREISDMLPVPRWLAVERFSARVMFEPTIDDVRRADRDAGRRPRRAAA